MSSLGLGSISVRMLTGGRFSKAFCSGPVPGAPTERAAPRAREDRARERVEQELRVARRIQQASLSKAVPELERRQIAPYYQPAREVGGDFYDLFELEDAAGCSIRSSTS